MRISVLVPCHDDGLLVGAAVTSVCENEPVEVVVVDDGSTDVVTRDALSELESAGLARVLRQSNGGVHTARTTGLGATSGRYVLPLDADDLVLPGVLAEMADLLDAEPETAAVVGDIHEFGDHDLVRVVPPRLDPYRVAWTNEYPATALFRRAAVEAVGGWRCAAPGRQGYDDWNLWMALAEQGARIHHLGAGRVGYRHRIHGQRLNARSKQQHKILYEAMVAAHPGLFTRLPEHRRRSDLSRPRRVLYPVLYGARASWPLERPAKRMADRLGIWTAARRVTPS